MAAERSDRLEVVDGLRGFALLGILYAHMIIWHTGGALPNFLYDQYDDLPSLISFAIFGTLVFGKFFALFSFLFGVSFHLSKQGKGHSFQTWFIRRLVILAVIGFIHHLIWRGDILLIYAILGFFLILADKMSLTLTLVTALILITNLPVAIVDGILTPNVDAQVNLPMQEHAWRYYGLLKHGTVFDFLEDNLSVIGSKFHFQLKSGRLLITMGFFLLGLWTAKADVLKDLRSPLLKVISVQSFRICIGLLAIAMVLVMLGKLTLPDLKYDPSLRWLMVLLYNVFNASLTIWYISFFARSFNEQSGKRILHYFVYPGKMALSGYVFQTLVGLLLFYPFGLALFEVTTPWVNVLLVIPVFGLQIFLSKWWMSAHKQGPLEWLWRQLTRLITPVPGGSYVKETYSPR